MQTIPQEKPRCRVTRSTTGRTWVRFEAKPPQPIREALKAQGAQFYRRHSAWLLPAGGR
jgi:hypothetical protein